MTSTIDLAGQVGIVTGASGGIGAATAQRLRTAGALVVGVDRDPSGLVDGDKTIDLLNLDGIRELVDGTVASHGRLDFLVNNAAVLDGGGTVVDCSFEQLELIMQVNVRAPFALIKAAIPHMLERGGGAIVNIASVLGSVVLPGHSAYCMSKGAVLQLTRSVSIDYAAKGIRCNALCPGTIVGPKYLDEVAGSAGDWVRDLHTVNRWGEPKEIADVVAFLVSEEASFIHGAPIHVDGGFTAW